jgi:hypothetical protein
MEWECDTESMSEEEALAGGTLTAVVRVGDTVRRPMNF